MFILNTHREITMSTSIVSIPFSGFGSDYELFNLHESAILDQISYADLSSASINMDELKKSYAKHYVSQFSKLINIKLEFKSFVFKFNMQGEEKILATIDNSDLENIKNSINPTVVKELFDKNIYINSPDTYNIKEHITFNDMAYYEALFISFLSKSSFDAINAYMHCVAKENVIISKMNSDGLILKSIKDNVTDYNDDVSEMFI